MRPSVTVTPLYRPSPKPYQLATAPPGLTPAPSRPEIYPLDWPMSFTSTGPGADDNVDSLIQRLG
jgi:hypothetical protein